MSYEQRMDFIRNRMRMSHVYQPVMLVTLLPKMTEDVARGPNEGGQGYRDHGRGGAVRARVGVILMG
jgi:hypothetical protein